MADLGCMIPDIYLWSTAHNPRIFVDKLDFRSGIGWGDGGEHRASLGLPGGPKLCVTNLCVMAFHPQSKAMCLKSLHPGVTVETVQQSTGFEVLLPEAEAPTTQAPSEEELRILREEVDPTSMRLREFPP
jgi:glutaconate CoA-transferase subunit B